MESNEVWGLTLVNPFDSCSTLSNTSLGGVPGREGREVLFLATERGCPGISVGVVAGGGAGVKVWDAWCFLILSHYNLSCFFNKSIILTTGHPQYMSTWLMQVMAWKSWLYVLSLSLFCYFVLTLTGRLMPQQNIPGTEESVSWSCPKVPYSTTAWKDSCHVKSSPERVLLQESGTNRVIEMKTTLIIFLLLSPFP